jgi:hypothetical protein
MKRFNMSAVGDKGKEPEVVTGNNDDGDVEMTEADQPV